MPLRYTQHQSRMALEEEFRNLYREIGRMQAAIESGALVGPAGPAGGDGEGVSEVGVVQVWTTKIDIFGNFNDGEGNGQTADVLPLILIPRAYTHLEVSMAVVDTSPSLVGKFTLRGSQSWYHWEDAGNGNPRDTWLVPPVFYEWSGTSIGVHKPVPSPEIPLPENGVAYYPIVPASEDGTDFLYLDYDLYRPGASIICFKAWVMGRYVLHAMGETGLFSEECPAS